MHFTCSFSKFRGVGEISNSCASIIQIIHTIQIHIYITFIGIIHLTSKTVTVEMCTCAVQHYENILELYLAVHCREKLVLCLPVLL